MAPQQTTHVPFNFLSFCLRGRDLVLGVTVLLNEVPRVRCDRRQAVKAEETWLFVTVKMPCHVYRREIHTSVCLPTSKNQSISMLKVDLWVSSNVLTEF